MTCLGIISGSGVNLKECFKVVKEHNPATNFGSPSTNIQELEDDQTSFFYLARHGSLHRIPPHQINYRANIAALSLLGVESVLALNAVGAISSSLSLGQLVVPNQIIDYTWGREHTTDLGQDNDLMHIEFSEPFDIKVRNTLVDIAHQLKVDVVNGGVVGVTQGPRLESAAEIRRLRKDGCDVVGMTSMPEAAIARELNLSYASLCIVTNPAAGRSIKKISIEEIQVVLREQSKTICSLLSNFIREVAAG